MVQDIFWIVVAAIGVGVVWWQAHVAYWDVQRCLFTNTNGVLLRDLRWLYHQYLLNLSIQTVILCAGIIRMLLLQYGEADLGLTRSIVATVSAMYASIVLTAKAIRQARLRRKHAEESQKWHEYSTNGVHSKPE